MKLELAEREYTPLVSRDPLYVLSALEEGESEFWTHSIYLTLDDALQTAVNDYAVCRRAHPASGLPPVFCWEPGNPWTLADLEHGGIDEDWPIVTWIGMVDGQPWYRVEALTVYFAPAPDMDRYPTAGDGDGSV